MRWFRPLALTAVACVGLAAVGGVALRFLAPDLSFLLQDRVSEQLSGRSGRPVRMALGVRTGSYYHLGTVLNEYLKEKAGYEVELVETGGVPQTVADLLDPEKHVDVATIDGASEAANAQGLYGLGTVGRQYFFIVVAADSTAKEVRDLRGRVDPGSRADGQPPTLGERVLEYYGLLGDTARGAAAAAPVAVQRPNGGTFDERFAAGLAAITRTQFLHSDLLDRPLGTGQYRLLPIRDHEALARWLPGTSAAFIPAGSYGPARQIPAEPTPTLAVATMIVARRDLPARVALDLLGVIYDPRFARDIQQEITEETGRKVGALPLHPAAEIYYRRMESVTADRIGRVSFVVTIVAAVVTAGQFLARFRRNERRLSRKRLLSTELRNLEDLRDRIELADLAMARALVAEADDLLSRAEHDTAAGLLDAEGIESLRSLHGICWRALELKSHQPVVSSDSAARDTGSAS